MRPRLPTRSSVMYLVACGTAGVGIGFLACYLVLPPKGAVPSDCLNNYPLVNPNIDCGQYEQKSAAIQSLDNQVDQAVADYIKQGKAQHVSVWVRDLTTQRWAATNESDRYAPASLLKVPLMIAYYKLAELQPAILDTKLTYTHSADTGINPEFPPQTLLVPGQQYTVEQLIEQMIVYSDNNAADVLASNISLPITDNIFTALGIVIPKNDGSGSYDFMTARSYASVFRSLYNASYLNEEYSEKALELLSRTTFEGFSKSLPTNIKVADKFGERGYTSPDGSQTRELHECGIIYKPNSPFILCIMTSGSNEDNLESIIENITSIVYPAM